MGKILLVEDDPTLNQNIKQALEAELHTVDSVYDGLLAERMIRKNAYDCVILDINLPGKNGFDLCSDIRRAEVKSPVLMLTAFDELEDKVKGFDCGADDYLTKPFYMRELLLRINALLKRAEYYQKAISNVVSFQDIIVHKAEKKILRDNVVINLTPREYAIMLRLVEAGGDLVSKKELIKEIWGTTAEVNTNTLEVYINFLRNKIDKPFGKETIKTRPGFGYYLH